MRRIRGSGRGLCCMGDEGKRGEGAGPIGGLVWSVVVVSVVTPALVSR